MLPVQIVKQLLEDLLNFDAAVKSGIHVRVIAPWRIAEVGASMLGQCCDTNGTCNQNMSSR